jgi:hypothetical protein
MRHLIPSSALAALHREKKIGSGLVESQRSCCPRYWTRCAIPRRVSRCSARSSVDAKFPEVADFSGVRFRGRANFSGSRFAGEVKFGRTVFADRAYFNETTFAESTHFSAAEFLDDVQVVKSSFEKGVSFIGTAFARPSSSSARSAETSRPSPPLRSVELSGLARSPVLAR